MTGRDNKRGRGVGNAATQRLSPIARELTSEREPEGQRFPRSISGSVFDAGDPVKQYSSDRICRVEGCKTKLSIYNPSDTCSEHPYTKMVMQTPKKIRSSSVKSRKKSTRRTTTRGK